MKQFPFKTWIGDLTNLDTSEKENLVGAVNELSDRVPAPTAADQRKFLRGDGQWVTVSASGSSLGFLPIVQQIATTDWEWSQNEQKYICTIYNEAITDEMVVSSLAFDDAVNIQATVYEGTADGTTHTITLKTDIAPTVAVTAYIGLTADGTTVMEDVSELTTPFIGATSSTDGREGLVPQPLEGEQNLFLCADGNWETPPGSKTTVKTYGPLTPTSNVLNFTQSDADIIGEMKAIKIEPSDPSVFLAPIIITCNEGSINITCSNMSGTCATMKVTLVMQAGTSSITSSEFDLLATRIGNLNDLDTDIKTSLVGAVNNVNDGLGTLSDQKANQATLAKVLTLNSSNVAQVGVAKGELVYFNGNLYVCKSAIAYNSTVIDSSTQGIYLGNAVPGILNDLFVTDRFESTSLTVTSGNIGTTTINVAKTGYTPIGIIGIHVPDTSVFSISNFFVTGNSVFVSVFNDFNQDRTSKILIDVMYRKS